MRRQVNAVQLALLAAGIVVVIVAAEEISNAEALANGAAAVVNDVEQGGLAGLEMDDTAIDDGAVAVREAEEKDSLAEGLEKGNEAVEVTVKGGDDGLEEDKAALEDGALVALESAEKGDMAELEKGKEAEEAMEGVVKGREELKGKRQDEPLQLETPVGFRFGVPLATQPVSGVTPGWDVPGVQVPGFGLPAPGQRLPPPPGPSAITGVTRRTPPGRSQSTTTSTMDASQQRILDSLRQFLFRLRNPAAATTAVTNV